jgi:type I restriction enzyme R subunit
MSDIGQSERATQNRVIDLFRDELGYHTLGDWANRSNNSNIEKELLTDYLTRIGYSMVQISRALDRLSTEAGNPNRSLYDNNKEVYSLLRYGIQVQAAMGENT